jgi:hypothetical protein
MDDRGFRASIITVTVARSSPGWAVPKTGRPMNGPEELPDYLSQFDWAGEAD